MTTAAIPIHAPVAMVDGVRQIHLLLDRVAVEGRSGVEPNPVGPDRGAREPGARERGARERGAAERAGAELVRDLDRAISRLQALRLTTVAALDRAGVGAQTAATGTGAWLAGQTHIGGAAAARDVNLATALVDDLPITLEALTSGSVSAEHAAVIASATARLPEALGADERTAIETSLVAAAKHVDPSRLRKAARRALAIAERTVAEVDAHEDAVVRSEEDRALARTRLSLHDNRDGTTTGQFTIPTLAAAILRKTVQQIASPRRFSAAAARAGAVTAAAQRDAFGQVDWPQRYGHAFVELLEHLPTDRLAGKVAATVVVTVTHDHLKGQLGIAHLDTGEDLSAAQARRLACNAGILPAVLGSGSLPLDLGRTDRFFTEAQRVALATAYDACAATGCDRPYAWSELHHEDPWSHGGRTDLDLAVPLCGFHHRRVHDPRYDHQIDTDPRGHKTVRLVLRR